MISKVDTIIIAAYPSNSHSIRLKVALRCFRAEPRLVPRALLALSGLNEEREPDFLASFSKEMSEILPRMPFWQNEGLYL